MADDGDCVGALLLLPRREARRLQGAALLLCECRGLRAGRSIEAIPEEQVEEDSGDSPLIAAARASLFLCGGVVIRIDCGGFTDFTNQFNESWIADAYYTGGSVSSVSDPGNFVQEQERTIRYFPISLGKKHCYVVPVPTGRYFIRMFFVYDNYDHKSTTPSFDVSVEGTVVFSWRSPWADDIAMRGAYSDLHAFVEDGFATVCLYSWATDSPLLGALEILQVDNLSYDAVSTGQEVILVNYGRITAGNSSFGAGLSNDTELGGRAWEIDTSFSTTPKLLITTTEPIRNTNVAPNYFPERLFQSARVAPTNLSMSYNFTVDSSLDYMLWFHFAEFEPSISGPGQRVFNITVNEDVIFTEVDVFKLAGNYAALSLNYTYSNLTDTNLVVTFEPVIGEPLICGMEVLAILEVEIGTDSREAAAMQQLKTSLQVPDRMGWNGDPCSPSSWDAWEGVSCTLDNEVNALVIMRLDLSNQGLKGYISDQITQLKYLTFMNFSNNDISGSIPSGLGGGALESVDLSTNSLTGIIPDSLGASQLTRVLLNQNLLTGLVPEALYSIGVRGGFINLSQNQGLCGVPSLPTCPHFWEDSGLSAGAKAGIVLASLVGAAVFLFLVCFCIRKRNSEDDYNFGLPHQLAMRHKRYMLYRATLQSNNEDSHMMRVSPGKYGFSSTMNAL
ncbi:hypothetical protein AXG93_1962s1620 [Marchantia polymorpha subsp. ruderalis]|uniref:Malectin-like domain-containing protein n=1 Tax=Marchantia polymorpha subsp. ruderalis TaxID=1480154 RepID=A0A176WG82_MARPO|nr:hypothetical protein AXG93_1962s1620 [Marchantia polymorpha subsp. ruderalis]